MRKFSIPLGPTLKLRSVCIHGDLNTSTEKSYAILRNDSVEKNGVYKMGEADLKIIIQCSVEARENKIFGVEKGLPTMTLSHHKIEAHVQALTWIVG
jgi:hypothetical protein